MKALLFSNSTNSGEDYLMYTIPFIDQFLKNSSRNAIFIPYAAITISYEDYYRMVAMKLSQAGVVVSSVHHSENPVKSVEQSEMIIIGGGNTFQLITCLQQQKLLPVIRRKVLEGTPYIGWSAGSNVACPSISTTNDMPVVEPESFSALNLIPFQINPHYTEAKLPDHSGETREMRILEYIKVNRNLFVAGLRESSLFWIDNKKIQLLGEKPCRIFKFGQEPKDFFPDEDISFLMQ